MAASHPQVAWLPPDQRLHLSHGPTDLIIKAEGKDAHHAYQQAITAMDTLLEDLVKELPDLRLKISAEMPFHHPVAQRMHRACLGYGTRFITPMAAVAGAIADYVLDAMITGNDLTKASVNNGGDIAFCLAEGQKATAVLADMNDARIHLHSGHPWRGMATSGHGGRSFSLGIADAVLVIADQASTADAAATMIASAVHLPNHHPEADRIQTAPAFSLDSESDLGNREVTTHVGELSLSAIVQALDLGEIAAQAVISDKPIAGALIRVKDHIRIVGFDHHSDIIMLKEESKLWSISQ